MIRTVRGRKVEDERERQVRVWLICFVEASHGDMKVLRRVTVVRIGKKKSEMRIRKKFWSMGCEERGVFEGIGLKMEMTDVHQRHMAWRMHERGSLAN